ncbi:hypothetical protein ACXHQN_01715 [Vibrio cincinnatiensis]
MEKNIGKQEKEIDDFIKSLWTERLDEELKFQKNRTTFYNKLVKDDMGVVHSTEEASQKVPKEPNFIKLYLQDISVLKGLQSGYKDILYMLLCLMKYDNYIFSVSKYDKEQIIKNLGLNSVQQVDNAIQKLKKAGIILAVVDKDGKVQRGTFEFNPYLFGKGNWVKNYDKRDVHKLTVLYRKNQKEVVNVDALIEYINTEQDVEKRKKAIEKLYEIRGYSVEEDEIEGEE